MMTFSANMVRNFLISPSIYNLQAGMGKARRQYLKEIDQQAISISLVFNPVEGLFAYAIFQ